MLINAKNMKLDKNPKFKSIIAIDLMIMEKLNYGRYFLLVLKINGFDF